MDTFRKAALLFAGLLAFSGNAVAGDKFWFGLKAGTLGIGAEGTWRPIDWLDIRLGGNRYDYNDNGSQSGINYDGTLQLQTYYATANLRFPLSPFRISVGGFSNQNKVLLTSVDMPSFEIGGVSFSPQEVGTLESEANWDSTSPYLGAGFDFELFNKVGLNFDFGVLWQGDPKVSMKANGTAAGSQQFEDALAVETAELADDLQALKAYPVLSMGFTYNF